MSSEIPVEDYALISWRSLIEVLSTMSPAELRRAIEIETAGKRRKLHLVRLTTRLARLESNARIASAQSVRPKSRYGSARSKRRTQDEAA